MDLEKGLETSTCSETPSCQSLSLPEYYASDDLKDSKFNSPSCKDSHLLSYGDRLVSNYLAPRRHPKFNNMHYDETILQVKRFRQLNISRIQHDLLRLQHTLTIPGGGTEENFARLSSLLHEHGTLYDYPLYFDNHSFILATALRDWDFIVNSTVKLTPNPSYMENLLAQYPELPWDNGIAPLQLALHPEPDRKPRDLISSIRLVLPRSWCWSKAEREMRPEVYKLDLQGIPGFEPRYPSLTATILAGIIVSLTSSIWILVPTIIVSFQEGRTKSLVTAAIAVTLFGFFLVVGVRTKTSETFLASATYAAILIVFVGSSNATTD